MQKSEFNTLVHEFVNENTVCKSVGADLTFWLFYKGLVLVRDNGATSSNKRYRIIDEITCEKEYKVTF